MQACKRSRRERRLKNKDCVYKGWNNVKESVIAKRTVKSHRTYMREGGWWKSVIVSVCMNKTGLRQAGLITCLNPFKRWSSMTRVKEG
jgi:hypothetical protein